MLTLSIRDQAFAHCEYSNNPTPPVSFSKNVRWDRTAPASAKTIYTDAEIRNAPAGSIVWLIEPLKDCSFTALAESAAHFREIWTCDANLLAAIPNGRFVPFGGCWIPPQERWVWTKTKGVSTIASNKRGGIGYDLRHKVIAALGSKIDAYGIQYEPLVFKIGALRDYRFQIVIENVCKDFWFTEKLIDCFATGTIPIYVGCPAIADFFNPDGIIVVHDLEDIEKVLPACTAEFYESKLKAVVDNYERAKKYYLAEDWLFETQPDLIKGLAI